MKKKNLWLGIPAITLVFAMTIVGCASFGGSSDDSSGGDPALLNATWIDRNGDEVKLNNGNLETKIGGKPAHRGTYTVSGNSITTTLTSIHGGVPEHKLPESKWYTKNDLRALGVTDAGINQIFKPYKGTYYVSESNLTLKRGMFKGTYTKKK